LSAGNTRAPDGPSDGANATIFVVEDDDIVRESLCALLEASGFAVHPCRDGQAFLDLPLDAAERPCVLLDVNMPGLSGLDVLDALRRRRTPMPPVILMTGGEPRPGHGAASFLRKPLRPNLLISEISRLVLSFMVIGTAYNLP
jgi:two-component system, LuxR family, response regulator FixJ